MTKNQSDINYIGKIDAEWVDPKVELPPEGWSGLGMWPENEYTEDPEGADSAMFSCGLWYRDGYITADNYGPFCWLRIGGPSTAIPRENVQGLADEFLRCQRKNENKNHDVAVAWFVARVRLYDYTGVTPTDVK